MEPDPQRDDKTEYNVFREDNSLEEINVVEPKPLEGTITEPPESRKPRRKFKLSKKFVILTILCMVLIAGGLIAGSKLLDKEEPISETTVVINTQSLDNGTLNQVTPDDGGTVRQQLTISPNTIFKSDVTVQGSAEIVKDLSVGGAANIQGSVNINNSLNVARNLTVNGLITAANLSVGSLTISSINLSSNLVFGGHIVPFGSEPTVKPSVGASGGSVSVSGNDTAGTITITIGGGNLLAGELAIVTFRSAFAATPKVQLTPLNAAASGLRYYATHTAGFFTINSSTAPTAGNTYIFDYLVTQ